MKKKMRTKPYNFLLEMLVVIVLFTFCMIIFVQVFAISSKKNNEADILANALNDVETYISYIKSGKDVESKYVEDGYIIYINEEGKDYTISATNDEGENIISTKVGVIDEK